MKKVLNNNALKIIAGISMLIDHVGLILFPNIIWLRVIGRIAFPIFAFCIAEGLHYTKNRKKYIILLLIFAMISQVPYYFIFKTFLFFNVLFTFLIAILCIILVEELKSSNNSNIKTILLQVSLVVIMLGLIVITPLRVMEYGIFGVLTTIIFYFLREKPIWKYTLFVFTMILLSIFNAILSSKFSFATTYQVFSILAIIPLMLYNSNRGKINLKYFFYIFYPTHLVILWLINFLL